MVNRFGMKKTQPNERLAERQRRLLKAIWPAGMPDTDRAILEAVPKERRASILDRLEAVWRADQGEPLGPLANLAGLKRAAFFNLRKAWGQHSLAGIVPNETRAGRKVTTAKDDPIRSRARELLRAEPRARNVDIAKRLLGSDALKSDRNVQLANLQRSERMVQHERRTLSQDEDFLRAAYGQGILVDITAISVILDEDPRGLAVVGMVIETASGIILGSALGRASEGVSIEIAALSNSLEFLAQHRADRPLSQSGKPDLTAVLANGVDLDRAEEQLRKSVDELTLAKAGGFSFGAQAVQNIGPRVGRMVLNPRRTLSIDVDSFVKKRRFNSLPVDQARSVWKREVDRHNSDRIRALVAAKIIDGGGVADGHLAKVIRATIAAVGAAQTD